MSDETFTQFSKVSKIAFTDSYRVFERLQEFGVDKYRPWKNCVAVMVIKAANFHVVQKFLQNIWGQQCLSNDVTFSF